MRSSGCLPPQRRSAHQELRSCSAPARPPTRISKPSSSIICRRCWPGDLPSRSSACIKATTRRGLRRSRNFSMADSSDCAASLRMPKWRPNTRSTRSSGFTRGAKVLDAAWWKAGWPAAASFARTFRNLPSSATATSPITGIPRSFSRRSSDWPGRKRRSCPIAAIRIAPSAQRRGERALIVALGRGLAVLQRCFENAAAGQKLVERRLQLAAVVLVEVAPCSGPGVCRGRLRQLRPVRCRRGDNRRPAPLLRLTGCSFGRSDRQQIRLDALSGEFGLFLGLLLHKVRRKLLGAFTPDALHKGDALLAQNPLHAANRIALAVEQMPYAAQQIDIVGPIIAPAAAALHRPDLRESALPEAQHVLRYVDFLGDLADGPKCVRRLFHLPCSRSQPRCVKSFAESCDESWDRPSADTTSIGKMR